MNLIEKLGWYIRNYGLRALLVRGFERLIGAEPAHQAKASAKLNGGGRRQLVAPGVSEALLPSPGVVLSAAEMTCQRFAQNQPLKVFAAPGPARRLNLVTDSVSSGSLFGGVGTAIILAAEMAKAQSAELRLVTRTQPADERAIGQVLQCNGIDFDGNIEFAHIPFGAPDQLDICDGDRFLTTSWWTTESVLGSISPSRVDYLLQEDERMFYPYGDDWVRCNEVLSRTDIRFVVNTRLLFQHLVDNGLEHLTDTGIWFEPAFHQVDSGGSKRAEGGGRRRLFFYARPNNLRNLFYRGIEVLDRALATGVVNPNEWEIVFIGKDAPPVRFSTGVESTVLPTMGWRAYGEFVSTVDLGLCLMATPHPSYPPFDLAASGAVVVTNRFGLKQDLSAYSRNVLCAELAVDDLVIALGQAIELVNDSEARQANLALNGFSRSWAESLGPIVERLS